MRKILATLVALSLLISVFTGIFALVPEAKAASPASIVLGAAGNFVILAKSGISNTGTSHITGDIGVSPAAASTITGLALVASATNVFATSSQVTGKVYAATYASPTPANMSTAVSNMQAAYVDAATRTPATGAALNIGGGTVAGQTLASGLYTWGSNVTITTDLTLKGSVNDVWIFQISGTLSLATGKKIILAGGAQASNVFWQVAGAVTLFPTSHFEGNILAQTNIALQDGATVNGRLLAQTAVTLIGNTISISGVTPTPTPTPTPVPTPAPITVYHQTFFIGYPDGMFKPDRNVSRAEVAAALTRALGLGWSTTAPSYPDVPATHWAAGYIQIMKNEGIMLGDTSGTFRPDAPITRAEAAAALLRMLKVAPIQNPATSIFKDVPVTDWAAGYIEAMQKNGYITGYPDGTYKPMANILRSEFTAIADRSLGREISKSSQVTGLNRSVLWPDVPATYWAYLYILEASTPHTVTDAVKLNRTIVLKTKTIPLFSDGTSAVTIHKAGDVLTAIVPVDGLRSNGSVPAARKITVVITVKLVP
ncbi:MAG: ice-binding family protein [Candidatus Cryosericum sp.]